MIILITNKPTQQGRNQYTLQDLESGYTRNWIPPHGMPQDEIKTTLKELSRQMECDLQLDPDIAAPIALPEFIPVIHSYDGQTLLADFFQYYLFHKEPKIAENTYDSWQRTIKNHLCPQIGHLTFNELTPIHIDNLYHGLYVAKYKSSSIIKVHTVLIGILKEASRLGCLPKDFREKIERPTAPKDEVQETCPESFSPSIVKYILRCADTNDISLKWRTFIHILIDTGVRRGECEGLQWSDIDFKNSLIHIRRSIGYTKRKGTFFTTTKNKRIRIVDASEETMGLLLMLYSQRQSDTWVFPQRRKPDVPMHPSSATEYLRRFSERFSTEKISPHKLRHTFASIAITSGADVESVSEILGHSDASLTLKVYTTSNMEARRRANNIRRQAIKNAPDL